MIIKFLTATVQGGDNYNIGILGPEYNVDLSVLAHLVSVAWGDKDKFYFSWIKTIGDNWPVQDYPKILNFFNFFFLFFFLSWPNSQQFYHDTCSENW